MLQLRLFYWNVNNIKIDMRRVLLVVLLPILFYSYCYGDSVYPDWIENHKEGLWLGVSVPCDNVKTARKYAVTQASLLYLLNRGQSKIQFLHDSSLEKDVSSSRHASCVIHSCFSVDIREEFYNNRGEYFVLCSFSQTNDSTNTILVERSYELTTGKESSVSLKYRVASNINREEMFLDYTIDKKQTESHSLNLDGKQYTLVRHSYPNTMLFKNNYKKHYYISDISATGSIGMAMLNVIAQSPNLPQELSIKSMSEYVDGVLSSVSKLYSSSQTIPFKIKFCSVRQNKLGIVVSDPYEYLRNKSTRKENLLDDYFIRQESKKTGLPINLLDILSCDDYIHEECGSSMSLPVLVDKTESVLDAISRLVGKTESVLDAISQLSPVTIINSTVSNNESYTRFKTTGLISEYYPFFLLDGNNVVEEINLEVEPDTYLVVPDGYVFTKIDNIKPVN